MREAGQELVMNGVISFELQTRLEGPLLPIADFSRVFREKVNELANALMSDSERQANAAKERCH